MSGYYLAPALVVLRAEIDTRWPRRDRASDGWIGDARHQASKSDHNPNERGSVNAADFDEDGLDFNEVFAAIRRHPSARYVIYERRLYHRLRGWRPEPYDGVNPHDKHFHLSIDQTREAEQDRRPWGLLTNEEDDMPLSAADISAVATKVWAATYGPETAGGRLLEARDEARRARLTSEAVLAAVQGDGTERVLARIAEVAAEERERDQAAARERAELAELVRQVDAGELDAEAVVRLIGERLTSSAPTQG